MMAELLGWLQKPLFPDQFLRMWHLLAGAVVLLAGLLALALCRRKKRPAAVPVSDGRTAGTTVQPVDPAPPTSLAVGNLQGLGQREEQQDAFSVSPLEEYDSKGLLAVLCDGMGGLEDGRAIAQSVVERSLAEFPYGAPAPDDWNAWLCARNQQLFDTYGGQGGSTLVTAYLFQQKLWFWCAGDSDLYLLREGALYAVNARQEYGNDLLRRALEGRGSVEAALRDPQAGALSEYLGNRSVSIEYSRHPFPLRPDDRLLLCSDGVSDTLPLEALRLALQAPTPQACCEALDRQILAAAKTGQDNYTAIVIDCARL